MVLLDCLGAIADWPAFKIAAGCRLHADARRVFQAPSSLRTAAWRSSPLRTPANALWQGLRHNCAGLMASSAFAANKQHTPCASVKTQVYTDT